MLYTIDKLEMLILAFNKIIENTRKITIVYYILYYLGNSSST